MKICLGSAFFDLYLSSHLSCIWNVFFLFLFYNRGCSTGLFMLCFFLKDMDLLIQVSNTIDRNTK